MAYTALEQMRKRNEQKYGAAVGPVQPELRADGLDSFDMKAAALRFIHQRCEGLCFDRQIEEEEMRTGVYRGTGSAPDQIPYNMQMDINRLCLERALEMFIDSGSTQDAYNVYYCYLEIFLGSYEKTKRMIELLSEYEVNGSSLLMDHRDHYSHSVYVFVLGLSIYETNAGFRRAFHAFYHLDPENDEIDSRNAANVFLCYWGLTALFHDIGYPFELVFEQVMSYFEADRDYRGVNNPFIVFRNMASMTKLGPQAQERFRQLYGKQFDTITGLLAHDIFRKLGGTYGFSEEYLRNILDRKPVSPEDFGYYMDHGYFSALRLFQTLTEAMGIDQEGSGTSHLQALQYGHVDALSAILLHYVIYAHSIAACYEGERPKLTMELYPLAWLLILCDELQCWDRTAYGRHSRSQLHPMSVEFDFRDNGLIAKYFYDEEQQDKIDAYLHAYAEWKLGGKVGDAPKLKAYSDMAGEKKAFRRGIENLLDLTGFPLRIVCSIAPVNRVNRDLQLSSSNFMHMHDFATALNACYTHEEDADNVDQTVLEAEFAALSLEHKMSNINRVKYIGRYLNAIHCFYTDRPMDFDMLLEFTPDQIEILAPMEHERWVREHQLMGWRRADTYEHLPVPEGVDEDDFREMLREQMRCHKQALDGELTKENIRSHYQSLPESEQGKDWLPYCRLLKLIRKFDGLRIYQINTPTGGSVI